MMRRLVWLTAVLALAWGLGVAFAQPQVTFVFTNGRQLSGTLVYHHDNNFNLITGGREQSYPQSDVAVIEFTAGTPNQTELSQLPSGGGELERNAIVLRDGRVIPGKLYDISDDGQRVTINTTPSDRQTFSAGDIARIYMNPGAARSVFNAIAPGGQPAGQPGGTIQVPANVAWTDTGIDVQQGERFAIQAAGQIRFGASAGQTATADGSGAAIARRRGASPYPVPRMGVGGLIGRVGNGPAFPIGSNNPDVVMPASGRLYLGINDDQLADNSGAFSVTIARR